MSALTDLLERHVPYASHRRTHVVCLTCLDPTVGSRCGEFPTAAAWAAHVERELRAAGLKVTRQANAPDEQAEAMF